MKRFRNPGTITSIGTHHSSPDHLSITVAHGPKKKVKKGQVASYDDRPTSSLMLPKEHASKYSVGQRVNVGMGSSSTAEPDGDDAAAPYRRAVSNIITGGSKSKMNKANC